MSDGDSPESVSPEDSRELLRVAELAAEAGAAVLRGYFRRHDLAVEEKQANDFVTEADHASERAIFDVLQQHFPDHTLLGEEAGLDTGDNDAYRWIVDPLDGTSNFLHGVPVFCVSIACHYRSQAVVGVVLEPLRGDLFTALAGAGAWWNGKPMAVTGRQSIEGAFLATGYPFRAKPALDIYLDVFRDLFSAARGIRRCGAAALDLAYTAAGIFDGFFEFSLSPWDLAAGELLVREAGGVVTDLDGGDRFLDNGHVLAGSPGVHRSLRQLVGRHIDEAALERVLAADR